MAQIVLPNDSVLTGLAVTVRRADGSTVPALFRGPTKLAQVSSGGDYEFVEDSLSPRIRVLAPGEKMRGAGGNLP